MCVQARILYEVQRSTLPWYHETTFFFLQTQNVHMHAVYLLKCVLNVGGLLGMGWSEEYYYLTQTRQDITQFSECGLSRFCEKEVFTFNYCEVKDSSVKQVYQRNCHQFGTVTVNFVLSECTKMNSDVIKLWNKMSLDVSFIILLISHTV